MSSKLVPFYIKSGLPYGKTIIVTLPEDRDWWLNLTEFEVLSQIRVAEDTDSDLLMDLRQYMELKWEAPSTLTIDMRLPGSATRLLKEPGYYDVILSDPFSADDYAVTIIEGPVYRRSVVTADTEEPHA